MRLPDDVRYALRSIRRMPMLAGVVTLSLAMGIGVNAVVFSWLQTILLRPLPGVEHSASFLWIEPRTETGSYTGASWLEYRDLSEQVPSLRNLVGFRMVPLYLGDSGRVERTYGLLVSGNYFTALGLKPVLGRFFHDGEVQRPAAEPVIVVSHEFWVTRYQASPSILGKTVRVNGRPLTIVGVAPPRFQGTVLGLSFDLWVPATMAPALLAGTRELEDRTIRGYLMMGRLEAGATRARAQGELNGAMLRLAQTYREANTPDRAELLAFWRSPRGPQRMMGAALILLQGIMLLLLLAVCGNTANLMLARASARQQETAIRLALGAGRWRIARLPLVESLMLSVSGALLGTVFATWGSRALGTIPPLRGLPLKFQVGVDFTTVAFAILLGVASGVLFGALPVVQLAPGGGYLGTRSGIRPGGRSRWRRSLMGIQVGLALVVLLVAGLLFRSFMETRQEDPGFRRDGVLLAAYDLTGRGASVSSSRTFAAGILQRLRAMPSVANAAIATNVPLDIHGMPSRVFTLEGRSRPDAGFDQALTNTVTPGYFETMGLSLREGRDFSSLDAPSGPPEAVVNEAFVRRFMAGRPPLGLRLVARARTFAIVGVIQDSLYVAFGEAPTPIIYFSYRDVPVAAGEVHVRARSGSETGLAAGVRSVVSELDADLPIYNVRTLNEHIESNLVFRRIPARLFGVLAPLLLLIVAVGIYAVVSYVVSLRTSELGVRLALGASAGRLIARLVGENMFVVTIGAGVGWILAMTAALKLGSSRWVDVPVFAGVPIVLLAVALVACWLPARRVTRVDPVTALREP
ncbi:MAG: ADOP family duplicated permease [Acidobacteriota bacterium]